MKPRIGLEGALQVGHRDRPPTPRESPLRIEIGEAGAKARRRGHFHGGAPHEHARLAVDNQRKVLLALLGRVNRRPGSIRRGRALVETRSSALDVKPPAVWDPSWTW